MISIKEAAKFIFDSRLPLHIRNLIIPIKKVFTFSTERANRIVRFRDLVLDYKAGMSVEKIEEKYGCSRHTIYRYIETAGLDKRGRHAPHADKWPAAKAMYLGNKPIAEISARLGVSPAWISKKAAEDKILRRKFAKRRN